MDHPDEPAAAARSSVPPTALRRRWTAQRAYRTVLVDLGDAVVAQWDGAATGEQPDHVHDLRIALRRSRSVLRGAGGVLPAVARDDALDLAGSLADRTGPVRDLDVQLADWDDTVAAVDADTQRALEPVRLLLVGRREQAQAELALALAEIGRDEWRARWGALVGRRTSRGGERPELARRPVGEVAARAVARAHRRVVRDGRAIDDRSPHDALHRLRKDAKRLRYLAEAFGPLVDDDQVRRYLRRVKPLLDHLGAHQDAVVHRAQLVALDRDLDDAPAATHDALAVLTEVTQQRVSELRAGFHDVFAEFDHRRTHRALSDLSADLRH